jgi:hypothetical protein
MTQYESIGLRNGYDGLEVCANTAGYCDCGVDTVKVDSSIRMAAITVDDCEIADAFRW